MEVAAAILDQVEARTHVFVLPLTYLKGLLNARYTASGGRCRFHVVRNPLSLTTVGMFHRKDLAPDMREAIEKRARYMIDSHLFERMIDTRVINYTRCLQEEEDHVNALSIGRRARNILPLLGRHLHLTLRLRPRSSRVHLVA
ncbi:hypothetical protein MTO96_019045 [Rhipicephalus appendiculatus]